MKKYFIIPLILALLPLLAQGQWPTTIEQQLDIAVSPITGDDERERAIPYPDGKTLVVWNEGAAPNYYLILYQIVDRYGEFLFPQAQCLVDSNLQSNLRKTIPDANGGAFILFKIVLNDTLEWIYAQKLDEFGNKVWGDTGVFIGFALSLPAGGGINPLDIVKDSADNSVFIFYIVGDEFSYALKAQKIDAEGNTLWPGSGVTVADSGYFLMRDYHNSIAPDMNGGVYAVWSGDTGGITKVYMQHLDAQGNRMWGDPHWGQLLNNYGSFIWIRPEAMSDGAGGMIVFDLTYIKQVNSAGNVLWSLDDPTGGWGVATFFHPGNNNDFYITTTNGSASSCIIRAWRVSLDGQFLWPGYHIEVANYHALIGQWCYGAFFKDNHLFVSFIKTPPSRYVISQKIDSSGNRLWGDDGVTTAFMPMSLRMFRSACTDQEDGIISIFSSTPELNLYGKRILYDGTLGGSIDPITTLTITRQGNDAVLNWSPLPEARDYLIYWSNQASTFPPNPNAVVEDTFYIDVGAVIEGEKFYRVTWER